MIVFTNTGWSISAVSEIKAKQKYSFIFITFYHLWKTSKFLALIISRRSFSMEKLVSQSLWYLAVKSLPGARFSLSIID